MGLDKQKMTPCGFCFVVYYTRRDAEDYVKFMTGQCEMSDLFELTSIGASWRGGSLEEDVQEVRYAMNIGWIMTQEGEDTVVFLKMN